MQPDPPIDLQVRYLALRLAACRRRPDLHVRQLAVLAALEAGAVLPEAEAVAIVVDGYRNRARVLADLGDDVRAAAYREIVATAGDDLALPLGALDAAVRAAEIRAATAGLAHATFARVVALIHRAWTAAEPGERAVTRLVVEHHWQDLRRADPGFDWERARRHRPYRERVPFDDVGLARFAAWLDALRAEPAPGFALPVIAPPPSPPPAAPPPPAPPPPAPDLPALIAALERDLASDATAAEVSLAAFERAERRDREDDARELLVAIVLRPLEVHLAGQDPAASLGAADLLLGARWGEVATAAHLRELGVDVAATFPEAPPLTELDARLREIDAAPRRTP